MKKLIAFIVFAAVVGSVISWIRGPGREAPSGDSNSTESSPSTSVSISENPGKTDTHESGTPRGRPDMESTSADRPGVRTEPEKSADQDNPKRDPEPREEQESADEGTEDETGRDQETGSSSKFRELLREGRSLKENGELVEARDALTRAYRTGDKNVRNRARELLDEVNSHLVFDADTMEGGTTHAVQSGETLAGIADQYGVNWRMIANVNGIENPGRLHVGDELKVLTGTPRIVVDKSDFRLTLYMDDAYIREYSIGIGKNGKTPTGTFTIETMLKEPTWYRPDGGVVEYGEEGHLLGVRWMGFKDKPQASGYGIHGTNDPSSIGTRCSNGCIRMHNEEVRELFTFVTKGTRVTIKE